MSKEYKLLSEKYIQHVYKESWTDASGFNGGVGYEDSLEEVDNEKESAIDPLQPNTALSSQLVGLFDPVTSNEKKQTDEALKELEVVLNKITKDIEAWQQKFTKLGATDTVSKEQLFQYIAKSVLGIKKLD